MYPMVAFLRVCAHASGVTLRVPTRLVLFAALAGPVVAQSPAPTSTTSTTTPPAQASTAELYETGRQLFEALAPAEIKEQFEFPSPEQFDEFAKRFQRTLDNGSLEDLAVYLPEARSALTALRALPGYEDYADWLAARIDEVEAADELAHPTTQPSPAPAPSPTPTRPPLTPPKITAPSISAPPPARGPVKSTLAIPHYDFWLARVRGRAQPPQSAELLPRLRSAFAAEGVPPELVWLAEAESSFNPSARSPAGAKGLFQLMPDTAKARGLSTFLPDERTDPEKSARVAARELRELHEKFGAWPLALAAYNAGAGRVSRALAARGAKDFAGIADALPGETRMYVPKVCALVAARTGVSPDQLPAPRARM